MGQRLTGLLVDITDRKRAEERLAMVALELQHRVKNSLAVVQALAAQTFVARPPTLQSAFKVGSTRFPPRPMRSCRGETNG